MQTMTAIWYYGELCEEITEFVVVEDHARIDKKIRMLSMTYLSSICS